jgi:outer membrane immunogenic protein
MTSTLRCAATAALLMAASAAAAGGSVEGGSIKDEQIAAAPASDWSGFYVGIHGGYSWTDTGWEFRDIGWANLAPGDRVDFEHHGGVFGAHVGVNHQIGSWVIGGELSYSGLDSDENKKSQFFLGEDFEAGIDSLFLATGKIGYAYDKWLAYVKGGYANARVDVFYDDNIVPDFIADGNRRVSGWTVGGGLAVMLSPNILVGVQYDFVDLGDEEFSERIVNSATGLDAGVGRLNVDSGNEVHLVTARLSLKFNREAAAPAPLK